MNALHIVAQVILENSRTMMSKKKKNRTIDGNAIYLAAGLYELREHFINPYVPQGYWSAGTRFIIERHIDKIGQQNAYEHFSLRLAGNNKYLIKSYQDEWNKLISCLILVTDDIEKFMKREKIPPLYILDQLEQNGKITRNDIRRAIEEREKLVE